MPELDLALPFILPPLIVRLSSRVRRLKLGKRPRWEKAGEISGPFRTAKCFDLGLTSEASAVDETGDRSVYCNRFTPWLYGGADEVYLAIAAGDQARCSAWTARACNDAVVRR